LLEQIGEGGFGVVFLAEQEYPVRRRVALKVIKPGMDTRQVVARFEAERQALALMDHPGIARVLDGGETESARPYFVMELVDGVPVTEFCDSNHFTIPQRLELFIGICQAVQHAHQKGVIHRDLKPSNILACLNDGKSAVKVIDFGIARAIEGKLTEHTFCTQLGTMVGTPLYMSPEQVESGGLDIDTRADIYSLGVLLYELLAGTTPFPRQRLQSASADEVRRIICEEEPFRPSTQVRLLGDALQAVTANRQSEPGRLSRLLRGELDWIVMKCLEKDRTRRYATANALSLDIERYLKGEPLEAGPPSAGYKLRKFASRHSRLLASATAFVLLLMAAAAVSAWLAVRAMKAERAASLARDRVVAEKNRADEESAVNQEVLAFLKSDLLGQADVGNQPAAGGRNRNVTVRELLDRASQSIETRFRGQALPEASIRSTLGEAYLGLGEYSKARKHLERALTLLMARRGDHHRDTLDCMNALATLHWQSGSAEEAEKLYREVHVGLGCLMGEDHLDTLLVLNNLAMLDGARGRHEEAESKFQRVVEGFRTHLGDDDPRTLLAMGNLAATHGQRGDHARANELNRQLIAELSNHPDFGPDHPRTLFLMNNLATGYLQLKEYASAQSLFEEVLQARRAELEPAHPDTLATMNALAVVYQEQNEFEKAEPLVEEALKAAMVKPGPRHPLTLNIMNGLATLRARQGRVDEATTLFEQVLAARRATLAADHPDTILSIHNLGAHYMALGSLDRAEPLLVEAAEQARKTLTTRHPDTQQYIGSLATLREKQGKTVPGILSLP
jgi:non-specific serine/threonine protein kinase/serine/threonine-protein kinase